MIVDIDLSEKYTDIIDNCQNMKMDELQEFQELMQHYNISYRHKLISSIVLEWRMQRTLERLQKVTNKINK